MRDSAKVQTLGALRAVRAALLRFAEDAGASVTAVDAEVQRLSQWLRQDRPAHWKREVRAREEGVQVAKAEIQRKILIAAPEPASLALERRAVARAEARLASALERQAHTKRWSTLWDRESLVARGALMGVSEFLHADVPKAVARLDAMLEALEGYIRLEAPRGEELGAGPGDGRVSEGSGERAGAGSAVRAAAESASSVMRRRAAEAVGRARAPRGEFAIPAWASGEPTASQRAWLESRGGEVPGGTLVVSWRALSERSVYLVRLPRTEEGDSGWYVGAMEHPEHTGACWRVGVSELLAVAPGLRPILGLEEGLLATLSIDGLIEVIDRHDRVIWSREERGGESERGGGA